jgi:hypothetical protein
VKLSSNVGAAHDAVSGFADVDLDGGGRQVSLGSSTIGSIHDGATVANTLLSSLSELVAGVKGQAGNVTSLATEIEQRDSRDAGSWSGKP